MDLQSDFIPKIIQKIYSLWKKISVITVYHFSSFNIEWKGHLLQLMDEV